jgi:hypothetical protein
MSPKTRRKAAKVAAVMVLFWTFVAVGAAQAQAAPASAPAAAHAATPSLTIPMPKCRTDPAAENAGTGLTQYLDPRPNPIAPAADPFAKTTTMYDQTAYAGLFWIVYDSCIPDLWVTADTGTGNMLMTNATWGAAFANGLHNLIATPSKYMGSLDDLVASVSKELKALIWDPWGVVSLLAVAALMLWGSLGGHLNKVVKTGGWALVVAAVATGIMSWPSESAKVFDNVVTNSATAVNAGVSKLQGAPTGDAAARAQSALVIKQIFYPAWLRGNFPSDVSPAAKKWGPRLFNAQANTWSQVDAAAKTPDAARTQQDTKAQAWLKVADEMEAQDPIAYASLTGGQKSRTGVAFMAWFGVAVVDVFKIIADLLTLTGLVIIRILVMAAPVLAVIGVLSRPIILSALNVLGAATINVIFFSIGATLHSTIIAAILTSSAQPGGNIIMAFVLCTIVTVIFFGALIPYLTFKRVVGFSGGLGGFKIAAQAGRAVMSKGSSMLPDWAEDPKGSGNGGSKPAAPPADAGAVNADSWTRDTASPAADPSQSEPKDAEQPVSAHAADSAQPQDIDPARWEPYDDEGQPVSPPLPELIYDANKGAMVMSDEDGEPGVVVEYPDEPDRDYGSDRDEFHSDDAGLYALAAARAASTEQPYDPAPADMPEADALRDAEVLAPQPPSSDVSAADRQRGKEFRDRYRSGWTQEDRGDV